MNVRVILKEFIALVRCWSANYLPLSACLVESLGISKLAKCLHGWLVDFAYNSLSLLNLDKLSEVPSELFRDVEVEVNVLHVNLSIFHDVLEQELIEDCRLTSDLFVDI